MKQIVLSILFLATAFQLVAQEKSSFTDSRDGKTYKTVKIGNQTWMAENLDYQVRGSSCYENKTENCDKYGRIYVWPLIMMGAEEEGVQGICPNGWHIPTDTEWQVLADAYKKSKDLVIGGESGFDATFGGSKFTEGNYGFLGKCATYWTSSEDQGNDKFAWTRYLYEDKLYKAPARYSTNKMYGQSVRCIKNK